MPLPLLFPKLKLIKMENDYPWNRNGWSFNEFFVFKITKIVDKVDKDYCKDPLKKSSNLNLSSTKYAIY